MPKSVKLRQKTARLQQPKARARQPVLRLQQLDQQLLRLTVRKQRRRAKPTQSPARRQRRPAKRMLKPAKLRRKTVRMQQPKARVPQLVLQVRRLLLPLHRRRVKKLQKPVKPTQRRANCQLLTRRKHPLQARRLQKQVKTQAGEIRPSQAAEPYKYVLQPLPDVWIPFNDSLDMITGFSPSYKKIVIGDDEITMPGDKIVKFKRASKATYINKSGVLTEAAIDEPRFEKYGLLIEGQRTNLLINSTNPSKWNKSSNMILNTSGVDDFGFQYAKFTLKPEMVGQTSAISIVTVSGSKGYDVTGDEKVCNYLMQGTKWDSKFKMPITI